MRVWPEGSDRFDGVILQTWWPDSLSLRGTGLVRLGRDSRTGLTLQWDALERLDVQTGNAWKRGALIGLAGAGAAGLVITYANAGRLQSGSPLGLWLVATGFSAIFTVPIRALIGSHVIYWNTLWIGS